MSYIAAFHCRTGIVMCADTQETMGDYKNYVEKIAVVEDFPLAVGGAGVGEIIDSCIEEIIDQAKQSKPETKADLKTLVKNCLKKVYNEEVPHMVIPRQHKTPHLLIAARTSKEGFCIYPTVGKRVRPEVRKGIIGYQTAYNEFLLKRFHRDTLSMQQAVMLAVYLVMRSKALDKGVGGDTRVAVVVDNGARIDDPEYIANAENRVREFLKLTDDLFLDAIDTSLRPTVFDERMEIFRKKSMALRERYFKETASLSLRRTLTDPNYKGDPYPKIFPGAITTVMKDFSVSVREETKEEREKINAIMELAKRNRGNYGDYLLPRLLEGRKIIYVGQETVTLYPKSGSNA